MGVKGKLAACAFMMDRQNRPLPRTRFSPNSSGTMYLMLAVLTLLIRPLMLFLSASHAMRWYSLLVLSVIWACSARSLAGGMYVPPDRMFSSFSYSALAVACFSSSVRTGGGERERAVFFPGRYESPPPPLPPPPPPPPSRGPRSRRGMSTWADAIIVDGWGRRENL